MYYDAEGERVAFRDEIFNNSEEIEAYDTYYFFKEVIKVAFCYTTII